MYGLLQHIYATFVVRVLHAKLLEKYASCLNHRGHKKYKKKNGKAIPFRCFLLS